MKELKAVYREDHNQMHHTNSKFIQVKQEDESVSESSFSAFDSHLMGPAGRSPLDNNISSGATR